LYTVLLLAAKREGFKTRVSLGGIVSGQTA
jgi:hypothetical protein